MTELASGGPHPAIFSSNLRFPSESATAFTAARPGVPKDKPIQPLVLGYNNTSLFWSLEHEKIHMNFYVDISDYLEQKLHALSLHSSQMRDPIHHSSVQNVEYTARLRGSEISVAAAEGYMLFRQIL